MYAEDCRAYDLLAFFFLDLPFNMPPRRMERFRDLGLASWEEEATIGAAAVGVFLFLR